MTIQEALDRIDGMMPNRFRAEDKIGWLATLDGTIYKEIILTHEPFEMDRKPVEEPDPRHDWIDPLSAERVHKPPRPEWKWKWPRFDGYDADTPLDTELMVQMPYSDVYTWYMACQIDLGNQELDKYQMHMVLFNTMYNNFQNWYNRTHMPLSSRQGFEV